MMRRRAYLRLAGVVAVGSVAGCASGGSAGTVEMTDDLRFAPETITVSTGTTVEWENTGEVAHTVTAYGDGVPDGARYFASGGFDSESAARANLAAGLIEAGETYERAFDVAGEYEYFCIPHEGSGMTGTVRVTG